MTKTSKILIGTGIVIAYLYYRKNKVNLTEDKTEKESMQSRNHFRATPPYTDNFKMAEFNSKDGALVPKELYGNVQTLMEQLEVLRTYLGSNVITINSGYRSPEHNEDIGGKVGSMHLQGKAVDFNVKGYTPQQVRVALRELIKTGKILDGGIGNYNTFTHYDIGRPRFW